MTTKVSAAARKVLKDLKKEDNRLQELMGDLNRQREALKVRMGALSSVKAGDFIAYGPRDARPHYGRVIRVEGVFTRDGRFERPAFDIVYFPVDDNGRDVKAYAVTFTSRIRDGESYRHLRKPPAAGVVAASA